MPLSRLIFSPPTYYYKVGVAFLAWLNGFQPRFAMLGGLERHRPGRIGLRACQARYGRKRGGARCQMQEFATGKFHDAPNIVAQYAQRCSISEC